MGAIERKRERRFGLADAVLLLTAVGVLLGGISLWIHREKGRQVEAVCLLRVTVRADGSDERALPKPDDAVRNGSGTILLGRVVSVEERPHQVLTQKNGEPILLTDNGMVDWEITVALSGRLREGEGLRVEDMRIAAGGEGSFRIGSYYALQARILSVEVMET